MPADDLWSQEQDFWTGDAAYYGEHLATPSVMVFPPPTGVLNRAKAIDAIRNAPRWKNVSLGTRRLLRPTEHTAVLAYAVAADRGDASSSYKAMCSSTYVRLSGQWKLVLHQQTPVG